MISDELRLSQVLINLLTNAIKFTPEYGKITMRILCLNMNQDSATLQVEIEDTGIGISEEQQKKLFRSFEQADGGITRQFGGTGLGLAICKKIVTLMNGDIWVESRLGGGSRFIFQVRVQWGAARSEYVQPEINKAMRILIVDDSKDVTAHFQNMLAGFSMTCDMAYSGAEALRLIQDAQDKGAPPYAIIFLDWRMPGMSGEEAAREIQHLTQGKSTIVIISVVDWTDITEILKPLGITHFLPKPILPSMLYNKMVQIAGGESAGRKDTLETKIPDWSGKEILVVEDIEINREIMLSLLEETGATIKCSENGLEAVRRFERGERFDLVLMDVQMPVLDGLGATRRIRELGLPGADTVPIIAMTANAFKEDVQLCVGAGMNEHIAKPIEVDALMEILSNYLGHLTK
jgi:CheY-like chemotaxis protein